MEKIITSALAGLPHKTIRRGRYFPPQTIRENELPYTPNLNKMKRTIYLLATGLLTVILFAFSSNNPSNQFDAKYFIGNWTYRSLRNLPMGTPFTNLKFAEAVMRFQRISGDSIFGVLDMGIGYALNLKGKLTTSNDATTFYIQGDGVPNTGTANWEYDYQGYVVPKWKNGVKQVDACTGSLIRAKPHDGAPAGETASFYMIRQ